MHIESGCALDDKLFGSKNSSVEQNQSLWLTENRQNSNDRNRIMKKLLISSQALMIITKTIGHPNGVNIIQAIGKGSQA
jgi:hypothetical protein